MKIRLKPINQQVVVLFGATSGIGLETALRMAEKGARVAIIGRSQEGLDIAVDRVREQMRVAQIAQNRRNAGIPVAIEDRVIGITADASDWDSVKSAADQVMTAFGRIDTWVHLAGVSEWALFEDTSPDEFRRVVEVNLVGQAYGAMAALPYLRQQGSGALIFVSSIAGRVPLPYQSAYVASKHGILGMADSLRLEMQHNQVPISVTAILPASINTPLFSKARTKLGVEPAPMPPVYDPKIAADAILYAATHPVREMMVGGAGYMMQAMRRLSYKPASGFMKATGFTAQRSDEVKSAQEADNLYHHISGYNQIEGEYGEGAKKFSMYTWLETHPVVRYVLIGSIIGGLAFLGARMIMGRRKKSIWQRMGKAVTKQAKAVKMPRVIAKKTLPQKVAHQARKQVKSVSHKLPFGQSAWYEAIPLISMLPFLRKKSMVEKARNTIGDTASSLGKSAQGFTRGVGKSAQGLGKSVSKTATKTFARTTDRASKSMGKASGRVNKAVDKVQKKQEDLFDTVKDTTKDGMKAVKSVQMPKVEMPKVQPARQSRMPFLRRERVIEETERTMPNGKRYEKMVETVAVVDTNRKMIDKVEKKADGRIRRSRKVEKV